MNIIVIQYHYDDFCHYNHEYDWACAVLPIIITITIITTITIVSKNPAPPGFFIKPHKKTISSAGSLQPLAVPGWKLHQGSRSAAASTECPQPCPRLWQGGYQSSDESRMIIIRIQECQDSAWVLEDFSKVFRLVHKDFKKSFFMAVCLFHTFLVPSFGVLCQQMQSDWKHLGRWLATSNLCALPGRWRRSCELCTLPLDLMLESQASKACKKIHGLKSFEACWTECFFSRSISTQADRFDEAGEVLEHGLPG